MKLLNFETVTMGSCTEAEVSCYVLSRVITVYDDYAIIDAGFLAISKDSPELNFGKVVSHKDLFIAGMSQEAGKLKMTNKEGRKMTDILKVDDLVKILPAHSCHTAAFHPVYHLVKNDENGVTVINTLKPCRGW